MKSLLLKAILPLLGIAGILIFVTGFNPITGSHADQSSSSSESQNQTCTGSSCTFTPSPSSPVCTDHPICSHIVDANGCSYQFSEASCSCVKVCPTAADTATPTQSDPTATPTGDQPTATPTGDQPTATPTPSGTATDTPTPTPTDASGSGTTNCPSGTQIANHGSNNNANCNQQDQDQDQDQDQSQNNNQTINNNANNSNTVNISLAGNQQVLGAATAPTTLPSTGTEPEILLGLLALAPIGWKIRKLI